MAEQVESVFAFISKMAIDIVSSPVNLVLVTVCIVLLYKLINLKRGSSTSKSKDAETLELPKMRKRDFTLEQLREYDGRIPEERGLDGRVADGRVLVAVNGKVFDVTRSRRFYGPGGPYAAFAGRDASRGLATFSVEAVQDEYDDLSDLNTMQMDSVKEWEMQFKEKYDYVGRLLKPGEEPNEYSDEEDSSQHGAKVEEEVKKDQDDNNTDKSKND